MIKYPMTVQGAKALEEEHAHLTKVVRPKLSQDTVSYTHLTLPTICSV